MLRPVSLVFVLLFLCSSLSSLYGQRRFNVGLLAGPVLSQLDGDNRKGYKKWGFTAGVRITGRIQENFYLSTEINYSQKGSRFNDPNMAFLPDEIIRLNYVEIPLLFHKLSKRIRISKEHVYHRYQLGGGLGYSRLVKANIIENEDDDIDYNLSSLFFNNNDLSLLVDGSVFINKYLAFNGRSSISVNRIFDAKKHPDLNSGLTLLRNYYITARIIYMFP